MKVVEYSPDGLKTMWEKEKLLITSNLSFHSVFKRHAQQTHKNQGLFGIGLRDFKSPHQNRVCINPFPNKPLFLCVCSTSLMKTLWEREKLLVTSNFSFSHSVFYPYGELSANLIKLEIVVCNSSSLEESKTCHLGKG